MAAPPTTRECSRAPRRKARRQRSGLDPRLLATALGGIGLFTISPRALAEEGRLGVQAGELEADARTNTLALRRHVVLTYGRYRIESEGLTMRLSPEAIRVDGEGRVALCPCPEPPVALAFRGARVTAEGDLFVDLPRLEVAGVPVVALPWFWLRAPNRVALLPPTIAWRGDAGLLIGAGAYLPWPTSSGGTSAIELTGAGYLRGGFEASARLRTETSDQRFVWDELTHAANGAPAGARVVVEGRGEISARSPDSAAATWEVRAIRGERGRVGTIDLRDATKPFDAAALFVSARPGSDHDALAATGVLASAPRGATGVAVGPAAVIGDGGSLGSIGSWDGSARGAVLRDPRWGGAIALGNAAIGGEIDRPLGPFDLRVGTLEGGRLAASAGGDGTMADSGALSYDGVLSGRAEVSLPLVRRFGDAATAPLEHRIAPLIEVRGALARGAGEFFDAFMRPLAAATWTSAAGVTTSLGRAGGAAFTADLRAGLLGASSADRLALIHARIAAASALASIDLEGAGVGFGSGFADVTGTSPPGQESGFALLARGRVGRAASAFLRADAAIQGGSGARPARAIAGGTAFALPGDELAYLEGRAVTGGAELSIPWARALRTSTRLDADLVTRTLLAETGSIAYRHRCGCVALGLFGSRRLGRPGVDVWASIELAPK